MISKSFIKSSLIFTVAGALPMIAGLILLPFYTNFLSDTHYTQVLFYISMSLLFQILFSFSVESYFGIKYVQLSAEPGQQKSFIGTTSILLLSIGVLLTLLTAVFGNSLFNLIYEEDLQMEFWPYGFYSILTGFFNSYFKAASICLMYLKQARLFFVANVVNFLVTLLISIAGLYVFPNSIVGPIYGRLISGLIIFLIAHYVFLKNGTLKYERSFIPELVKFCSPFVFYVLCIWVLGQIDRYFLQAYIPKADLNTYDLALKCFFGVEFIQNTLYGIINPKIYQIWNNHPKLSTTPESNRYFNVFTAINILLLTIFCIALPIVYKLLIKNPLFYRSETYIGVLAAGYALRTIHLYYLATILFSKKVKVLLAIFGCSAAIQILITVPAIKLWGLEGAIYAGLITKVIQVGFSIIFTRNLFEYNYNIFKIIGIPLIFFLLNLLQFLAANEYNAWMYVVQLFLFSFIIFIVFRKEIQKVWLSFSIR